MLRHITLLLLLTLSSCSLFAESSVWRVSKEGKSLYLGGTCHALRPSDYPLPAEFELAYSLADALVFEMDPALAKDPNFTFELLKAANYKDKNSLKTVLSKKTYKALHNVCEQYGISLEVLEKTKPGVVIMMLMIKELKQVGVTAEGVDLYFHGRGLKDKKNILALETAEFQIDLIVNLGDGIENKVVTYGLKDIATLQNNFNLLTTAWEKGNLSEIDSQFVKSLRKYPKLYKKLLVDRNNQWISHLESYMQTPEIEFVLAGVAHMAGNDGLIKLLQKKGYTIEQISVSL